MTKGIIDTINKIDLNSDFAYEHLFAIFSQIENQPYYIYNFKKESNYSFFRSRKNECFCNYFDFKDLSYPPRNKVYSFSRANKPSQNLFYISDQWITNLLELKLFWANDLLDDDIFWVTTGKWDLIEDISVVIIPDFSSDSMKSLNNLINEELTQSQIDFLKFINSKFKEQAFKNSNVYKLTSAFCNSILYQNEKENINIDGILFTSVQGGGGLNLALNPRTIDLKKFRLNSVVKHLLRKTTGVDNKPVIDNFNTPIAALELDYANEKIIWEK
ncbi:MAG: hypothetical protein PHP53_06915 [Prolixibacteraceae bacterium]|nr:hypothetical protein [Prolixibacteraceae bacterium]